MHSDTPFSLSVEHGSQIVMITQSTNSQTNGIDTLAIPVCFAILSAFLLLSRCFLSLQVVKNLLGRVGISLHRKSDIPVPGIGKGTILVYRSARLLGCLVLLGISVTFLFIGRNGQTENQWTRRQGMEAALASTYWQLAIRFDTGFPYS
ncbi:hypothetical protein DFH07DRAFT_579391 [Mycena maculata]|uniref:Transmembrane protein n=1 Tax=Mycena maculata TaxID=230809 RepID=A0AAD7IQ07_9AGAR|nr:hypothetical protein DFH07DRAFT_579391 [Mycena maculata]